MLVMQEESGQPMDRQKMEGLHLKYINLAKDAEKLGDRILSENYYQHAEHCLHAINDPMPSVPIAASRPSVAYSHSYIQAKQPQNKGKALPFRGSFLRQNRRNSQG